MFYSERLFFIQRFYVFFSASALFLFPAPWHYLFFSALAISAPRVLGQCPRTLMEPGPKGLNGRGPEESLLVGCARAQGSVERAPCFGVYTPYAHVGGHRPVASLRLH